MKYVSVLLFVLVPLAFANPVVVTLVNEFGFDSLGLGWMELHAEPGSDPGDLTGWQILTNTSACTLACVLGQDAFLVVDSASLAGGEYGRGSFRLDPAGDCIRLAPDSAHGYVPTDSVTFPVPGWRAGAPMPPALGSAARLNVAGAEQVITWYLDSTPTIAADNDDYSSVAGTVNWAASRDFDRVEIVVSGPLGGSFSVVLARMQSYLAEGLSAGRYAITAHGQPGNVVISYPDSVDVGYSTVRTGVNIDFDPEGVAETMSDERGMMSAGPTVVSGSSVRSLASTVVFDAMGRRVLAPKPGVYFVREAQAEAKAQAVRKVIIQR